MAEALFDREGNLTNPEELTVEEVAAAYQAKNQEVFARAKTAEEKERLAREEAAALKAQLESSKPKPELPDEVQTTIEEVKSLKLSERKRVFGYENGLSPEETDAVFRINPNPTKESLDDPFIKGGIDALRGKRALERNTPSSSASSPKFNGKDFSELEGKERDAHFQDFLKSKIESKR